ncbi:glycosyltransferase family 2 protein [Nonlabens ulvanivorans]|uniref:glycosyltransferase family 2 protein n=1 Tax=Nonlabens ulvanivorans TaxID=906888 RepID=UPI002942A48B|nr:glycosyltransferase family 2 protein [Nonlabens ulvanivorans]WOI22864.1 glycosyltransferase family 2 protein [Nonlabens ulvanivorans]
MSNPNILVIIPVYNKQATIERAINSVLAQTVSCDLLVIDDGSKDYSASVVEKVDNPRLSYISQPNHGVSFTRNRGIKTALKKGYEYVAFLDADDYWLDNHMEQIEQLIEKFPEASVFANNYHLKIGESRWNRTKFSNLKDQESQIVKPFFKANYLNSILSSSSYCMRLIGNDPIYYNEELTHTEDTDFLIKVGLTKTVAFNNKATVIIDKQADNRSDAVHILKRTVTNFDCYEEKYKDIEGLKKYLDINRFSIAVNYRMYGLIERAVYYQRKIDLDHLSSKQQQLLKMSRLQLKALHKTKKILEVIGLDLRTG